MRLLNIVQEILDEKYISKGNLMIEPEAGMRIEIKGEDFLCYKFGVDVHKEFLNHFSDSSGLKKMADYIIFQQVKEQLLILQVELKKGKANNSASVQLRACDEFSRYIIHTIERIGKELSENDCKFFKIRIYRCALPPCARCAETHDKLKGIYERPRNHIPFRHASPPRRGFLLPHL